ncbi:MAG: hypothetical protein QCH96_06240, partial [Candidatus Thermoplasmatota archaeon]|nr:hypothetical protein [Candidatus Thermoplasmatota archaeon]
MKKHNKMIIVGIVFLFITSSSLSASNPKKSDNCVADPCESLMKHIQEDLSFETEGYMISGSKSINDLDLLKKTDDCYGFIVPIKNNDSIFYSSIQRSISNLVNDLLRLNNTVFWSSSDFVALTRKPYNDSTKIRSFEKGAFIIPLTKDDMSNAIIASIIHDYEYGSEIETQAPVDIYLLLEPLLEEVYPLEYPRVVLNFGSLVALMDIFWYVDVLQNGGFFDNQLLLDEQIPNALKNDDVTLFIWPGVITDIYIQRLLNSMIDPVLCTAIRDFVKNGGGYIGSCHGAITASSGQYLPFNILQSRLERFPVSTFLGLISDSVLRIRCGGIITVNFTDLNHPATFGLERTQKSMFIYGPVFQNRTMDKRSTIVGVLEDIEPLWWDSTYENIIKMDYERYVNERVGKPIWVESEFGEGRTFVFGDHPEFFLPNRHDRLMHNVFFYITANDAMSICLDTSVTFERILSYYSATDNLEIPDHKPLFLDINALSLSLNMTSIEIDDTVKRIFSRMITSFDEYGIDERLYTLFGFYLDPYQTWIDRFLVALKRLESISSISMNSMVISSIIDTWEQDITKELEDGFLFCQDVRDRLNLISEKVQSYVGSQREETDLFTLFEHLESSYKQGYNSLTRLVSLTTKAYREIWYRYEGEQSVIEPRQIRLEFLNDQHKYIAEEQDGPRTFIVDDDSNYGGNGCNDHP